ncbi:MAG: hypothetical protein H6577_16625 [Lewinellaceae bacterium]|nr:hypothetical protein [Saprospiraceae bacterium]MCB9339750.1 hypothetical protein [Lewinellaceae bacterium]
MGQVELYQSVLEKLSHIPVEYLQQVDAYLSSLVEKAQKKKGKEKAVKSFAGAWSDMSEEDFQDYLKAAKETGNELFNRQVEL